MGCSWNPSPALITELLSLEARNAGAPEQGWRRMRTSHFIASMLRAVSSRVSPFTTLLVVVEMFSTSAERRLPASSKDVLVLVLGS